MRIAFARIMGGPKLNLGPSKFILNEKMISFGKCHTRKGGKAETHERAQTEVMRRRAGKHLAAEQRVAKKTYGKM